MFKKTTLLVLLARSAQGQDAPACKPFKAIYAGGKELCENMWNNAFTYEKDEENAYTMWFFDHDNNPNDMVSERLSQAGRITGVDSFPVDTCHLQYSHKPTDDPNHPVSNTDHPNEEPTNFKECHPWAERSCCFSDTISTVDKINQLYGDEWHWDRCGKLSQACERFFVQEACFYECEPNVGLFRNHPSEGGPDSHGGTHPIFDPDDNCVTNSWEVNKMPIKASYCDAWWHACQDDLFCSEDDGNFFSCAKAYVPFVQNAGLGSCKDSCGMAQAKGGDCGCDQACEETESCCKDRAQFCKAEWSFRMLGTCKDSCNGQAKDGLCYCDNVCQTQGDCCEDIDEHCSNEEAGSCENSCGQKSGGCYCDSLCTEQNPPDCCPDYAAQCS